MSRYHSLQQGASLFIALVALLGLTLTGLALVRSMDTARLIAGNYAFRLAALRASDVGLENTLTILDKLVQDPVRETTSSSGSTYLGCLYYPYYDPTKDTQNGLPNSSLVNWNNLGYPGQNTSTNTNVGLTGYNYKCVIQRICQSGTIVTAANVTQVCLGASGSTAGSGSSKLDLQNKGSVSGQYYEVAFRATVQINAPHGTTAYAQSMMVKYMPPL